MTKETNPLQPKSNIAGWTTDWLRGRRRTPLLAALFASLIAAAAVVTLGSSPASAAGALQGAGTSASPYLITSDADLDTAASMIDNDSPAGANAADYELTANLDYSDDPTNGGSSTGSWTPIAAFSGTFNGNGYTISNMSYSALSVTNPDTTTVVALFATVSGATIENLGLSNISGTAQLAGGVVGSATGGATVVTGVSVTSANLTATGTANGGGSGAGGLVGSLASGSASTSASLTDDSVTNSSVSASKYGAAGILGEDKDSATISDDYVNVALTVNGGAAGQYYDGAGLVGYLGSPATGALVTMTNNAVSGSVTYTTTSSAVNESSTQVFSSPTVGWAENDVAEYDWWIASGNLVSSSFSYTGVTHATAFDTSPEGDVDGTSVSPTALATEATYSGTATGVTDPGNAGATFNELGWNFGTPDPSGWAWGGSGSGAMPIPDWVSVTGGAGSVSLATTTYTTEATSTAPGVQSILAALGASLPSGATGSLAVDLTGADADDEAVAWDTPGSYTVTVYDTASNDDVASATATVVVEPDTSNSVFLQSTTDDVEATTTAPTAATVLSALGASLPAGSTGSLAVDLNGDTTDYPGDNVVDFDTSGSYQVTVYDTNPGDDTAPATATIVVVPVPVVTLQTATLYYNAASPPTAAEVASDAGSELTDGAGNSIDGSLAASVPAAALAGTAGSYTATVTGTDDDGFTSAAVDVTVDVSGAMLTVSDTTAVVQATSGTPSAQTLTDDLGAALADSTGSITLSYPDGVNFDKPGEYSVEVSDGDANDAVAPVSATIEVVPASVVTVANSTVYFNASSPPTAAEVQSAAGAELTDGSGNAVAGTLSTGVPSGAVGGTPGTYTATIVGSDFYGFTTETVDVSVVITNTAVTLASTTAVFEATGTTPTAAVVLNALGATLTGSDVGGQPTVDLSGVNFDQPGTYRVVVADNDAADAASTATATVDVVPAPVITVPDQTVQIPEGASATLPEAVLISAADAQLTDGSDNQIPGTLTADTSGVDPEVSGTYPVTITGTDAYGFTATLTVEVDIYVPAIGAGAVTIDGTAVVGSTLTADTAGWPTLAALQYQWFENGLAITGAAAATYTVTAADLGQSLSVQVSESPEWYSTASATSSGVTVLGQAPTAAVTAGGGTATTGQSVSFDASGSTAGVGTSIASYSWTFGDGATDTTTGPSDSHAYSTAGSYTVTVMVTDADGQTAKATTTVTVSGVSSTPGGGGSTPDGGGGTPSGGGTTPSGGGTTPGSSGGGGSGSGGMATATTPAGTTPATTGPGISDQAAKTTFTPAVDVLKPGVTSATVVLKLPIVIKKGTKLAVTETEPAASGNKKLATKTRTTSAKVATAGQIKFATGKLPAGTTVIRFYETVTTKKKVGKTAKTVSTKKLVKTETVKVGTKAKDRAALGVRSGEQSVKAFRE